ncbi:MAG: phospholipase D-like domain-containing protein [Candidatus Eremiobacteraeota bacterium]|nr:phospholipase D-like domain-containing protein [Candidatus Eremiobacteraeota bacterium]
MITLSSSTDVVTALQQARHASLSAYILRPGPVERALIDAAQRGTSVTVRLEGRFFDDPSGALLDGNLQAIEALRAAGADARLADETGPSEAPVHAKMLVTDDACYLDDRNWAGDAEETILRDTFPEDRAMARAAVEGDAGPPSPFFAVRKHDALASEARLLRAARAGDDVVVESESFGAYNAVYDALHELAADGSAPRILVAQREVAENAKERAVLETLAQQGAQVRVTEADEKFALASSRAWIGSANATAAFDRPDQIEWSVRTDNAAIVAHERAAFESRWQNATALPVSALAAPG